MVPRAVEDPRLCSDYDRRVRLDRGAVPSVQRLPSPSLRGPSRSGREWTSIRGLEVEAGGRVIEFATTSREAQARWPL
jgi:hypothetical protein